MASSRSRLALVVLEALVSLTGIGRGIALDSGLEGGRFPLGLLHGTPFSSYVIPGPLLAVFVGGSAAAAMLAVLPNLPGVWVASLLSGVLLMGWIGDEVAHLPGSARSWAEAFLFACGLSVAGLAVVASDV